MAQGRSSTFPRAFITLFVTQLSSRTNRSDCKRGYLGGYLQESRASAFISPGTRYPSLGPRSSRGDPRKLKSSHPKTSRQLLQPHNRFLKDQTQLSANNHTSGSEYWMLSLILLFLRFSLPRPLSWNPRNVKNLPDGAASSSPPRQISAETHRSN